MQSLIPLGHILRERYVIQRVLGQGGMGRTYLAEDLERFRELCVLKEFIPPVTSVDSANKAKELFQREASLLYQIDHPQIPRFRASFEVEGRQFLVQDYIEGKTFRALLRERQQSGKTFHEIEIVQLLQQILPVLTYLHDRQIIHRDISPDNLMLRSHDQTPVLIDFGVGKEVATQLHDLWGATIAGKPGYAAPEQLRTGQVFPSSDLYSLAATALVLLTGRDPQDLFDEAHLVWQWQKYVTLSAALSDIFIRMLHQKPADRFSDAKEVLLHLQYSASEVRTLAIDRHRSASNSSDIPDYTLLINETLSRPRSEALSRASWSWWRWLLGILLILLTGVASWVGASFLLSRPKPIITPSTPLPTSVTKDLNFGPEPNQITTADQIQGGQSIIYRFRAKYRQKMTVELTGTNLQMTLLYEDQKPIDDRSSQVSLGYWQGQLPASGAYFIEVKALANAASQELKLYVALDPPPEPPPLPPSDPPTTETPEPEPSPEPTATPEPEPSPEPTETPEPEPSPGPTETPETIPIPTDPSKRAVNFKRMIIGLQFYPF